MARPTTKEDLIAAGTEKYQQLIQLIESIPTQHLQDTFNFDVTNKKEAHWTRDKNIRDVLIHLYEWHMLLLNWVESNQKGTTTPFLKEGYNWKTYGKMNEEFWQQNQDTPYPTALSNFKESHKKVMALEETFTNEELFSKGVYSWTIGSTLGSYFVSTTSSHYDWAIKKIKLFKKSLA